MSCSEACRPRSCSTSEATRSISSRRSELTGAGAGRFLGIVSVTPSFLAASSRLHLRWHKGPLAKPNSQVSHTNGRRGLETLLAVARPDVTSYSDHKRGRTGLSGSQVLHECSIAVVPRPAATGQARVRPSEPGPCKTRNPVVPAFWDCR